LSSGNTTAEFLEASASFLAEAIERSEAALAVTTAANIRSLKDQLGLQARQVEFAERSIWYRTPISARNSYRAFLNTGLQAGAPWVRIIGEPVWAGRSDSEVRVWARYESLLNIVFSHAPVTILCPYDARAVNPGIVRQARVTHPHIVESDELRRSPEFAEPSGFVLEL
jgi:hypothetical protein